MIAAAPPDVLLQLRVPEALAGHEALRADRLRVLGGPAANVTVAVRRPAVVSVPRRARSAVASPA